jgi:hypothetical protein
VRIATERARRKRFDPVADARWQRRVSGGKISHWVDRALTESRSDRRDLPRQ